MRCRQRGMALSVPLGSSRHLVPRAWTLGHEAACHVNFDAVDSGSDGRVLRVYQHRAVASSPVVGVACGPCGARGCPARCVAPEFQHLCSGVLGAWQAQVKEGAEP